MFTKIHNMSGIILQTTGETFQPDAELGLIYKATDVKTMIERIEEFQEEMELILSSKQPKFNRLKKLHTDIVSIRKILAFIDGWSECESSKIDHLRD